MFQKHQQQGKNLSENKNHLVDRDKNQRRYRSVFRFHFPSTTLVPSFHDLDFFPGH